MERFFAVRVIHIYNYILFDLDGTLTDPKEGITRCVQHALRHFGIEREPDSLTDFIGPPLKQMFETTFNIDGDEAVKIYRERFSTVGLFENGVYDGIPELLEALKAAGVALAVATSKPTVYTLRILEKYDLLKYFDCVVGSELDGRRTDKAEVIKEVIDQLGITDLSRAVMVGDRIFDMQGAAKCGIDCVLVEYGYAPEGEIENCGALYTAKTTSQLEIFLLNR